VNKDVEEKKAKKEKIEEKMEKARFQ